MLQITYLMHVIWLSSDYTFRKNDKVSFPFTMQISYICQWFITWQWSTAIYYTMVLSNPMITCNIYISLVTTTFAVALPQLWRSSPQLLWPWFYKKKRHVWQELQHITRKQLNILKHYLKWKILYTTNIWK